MGAFAEGLITIALAGFVLAIISVLVSRNAQTPAVIQALASGEGNIILAGEAPVLGNAPQAVLSYPSNTLSQGFGF
jgi:hypothetical protein